MTYLVTELQQGIFVISQVVLFKVLPDLRLVWLVASQQGFVHVFLSLVACHELLAMKHLIQQSGHSNLSTVHWLDSHKI